MTIVHLTASTLFGGPERQMLGLGQALGNEVSSAYLAFAENGRCADFLAAAEAQGIEARALHNDTPHLFVATNELEQQLRSLKAEILLCHGYKANFLGRIAARRVGIPVVAVSRGWTSESLKVRLYEALDRRHLRFMDCVVCVSEGQANRVRRAGVAPERVRVIRNAIRTERFSSPDPEYQAKLKAYFSERKSHFVGAAGRLSPEKGFGVLIEAARRVRVIHPDVGFLLFGDGPLRGALERQIVGAGLKDAFVITGFRRDLDAFLPWLDLVVMSSFTEGLPNVLLEACAAGRPVVATSVGGIPEVVEPGLNGYLVPPGDAEALAEEIECILTRADRGRSLGLRGRERVQAEFTFDAQAAQYRHLFEELTQSRRPVKEVSHGHA